jgi:hypothetical protein
VTSTWQQRELVSLYLFEDQNGRTSHLLSTRAREIMTRPKAMNEAVSVFTLAMDSVIGFNHGFYVLAPSILIGVLTRLRCVAIHERLTQVQCISPILTMRVAKRRTISHNLLALKILLSRIPFFDSECDGDVCPYGQNNGLFLSLSPSG